jgi:tetratricopeptide (TPR) repeat protein
MSNLNTLGLAFRDIGRVKESIIFYEQGLGTARATEDHGWESAFLCGIGIDYSFINQLRKAIEHYEQALLKSRKISDRAGEGTSLSCLGSAYCDLGDVGKAIEFYEKALVTSREIGDRRSEEIRLGNLGSAYADLGDTHKSIECYEQSLSIAREIGSRRDESDELTSLGTAWLSLGEYQKATVNFTQSIQISDEISLPREQLSARLGLVKTFLFQNDLTNARATIEAAPGYDVPENNHNASALHGIIALRQGERETAQEAFRKSIAQADEILAKTTDFYDALDAKGLALCGKVVSSEWKVGSERERDEVVAEAVKTFKRAREIAPHAGVVKSVLRLFDELVKCDEAGVLKDVRQAVQGQ